jgi:hypothetical protein
MVNSRFNLLDVVIDEIGLDGIESSCRWGCPEFEANSFMRNSLSCPEELAQDILCHRAILEVPQAAAAVYRFPERHSSFFLNSVQFVFWGVWIELVGLGLGMPEKRAAPELSPDVLCVFLEKITCAFFHFPSFMD